MVCRKTPHTVIIKATNECNLSCKYCYVESAEKGVMSPATMEKVLEQIGEMNGERKTEIIWHGGEPLKAGLEFYERAAFVQYWLGKTKNARFSNSVQTNGTFVNSDVIDFCKRHDFHLGFSLDGPEHVHGLTRVYSDGANSFNDVLRGLMLAREADVGGGAITILNRLSLPHIDAIYDFFKEHKLGIKMNPLINAGSAARNIETLGITPAEYADAMIHLFDRYFNDKEFTYSFDPFDILMGNVTTEVPYGCCTFSKNCQENFVSVAHNGDVFPCGRFDGIHEFSMGNIHEKPLVEIVQGELRQRLLQRGPETVTGCNSCEYSKICNSGCMNNGYMRGKDFMDKDYYCGGYKKLFKHIQDVVDVELAKVAVEE